LEWGKLFAEIRVYQALELGLRFPADLANDEHNLFRFFSAEDAKLGIQRRVRRKVVHLGAVSILAVCMWSHISELFDHWDNTFQTGNDIEYSTVIVVLIAGAAIAFAHVAAIVLRTVAKTFHLLASFAAIRIAARSPATFIADSPPLPLRI
jgi:hypothetical protein